MLLIGTDRGFFARVCKTVFVSIVAMIMALVALGNLTNYDANWPFVRHVLAMDTIFPGSRVQWRAITNPGIQTAAYLGIIGWEVLCAAITGSAAFALLRNSRRGEHFREAVPLALLGIAMVSLLFGVGFLAIGGEWFLMWQSTQWNGTESATRYLIVAGLTLLTLLAPDAVDEPDGTSQDR
jgi:predicted small integral membrane protein